MAKKESTITIEDKQYTKHGCCVTVDGTRVPVGFAPVRKFSGSTALEDFIEYLRENPGDAELNIKAWVYGTAVRFQAMVRSLVKPDDDRKAPTQAEFATIVDSFTPAEFAQYVGNFNALSAEVTRRWAENRETASVDLSEYANKVWTELL